MNLPLNFSFILIVLVFFTKQSTGQNWSNVNSNIRIGTVLKVFDGKLYTCGNDTNTVTSNDKLVSTFDGIVWDTLPGKLYSGNIQAMESFNGDLFMAGNFRHIGSPVNNINIDGINKIAKWDGIQYSNPAAFLSTSIGSYVYSMTVYNNNLVMGGDFNDAGVSGNIIALSKYDGVNWSAFGGGLSGFNCTVYSMTEYNGDLIVAGQFTNAGGVSVNNIARWDGNQWHSMGDGLDLYVFYLYVDSVSNTLYATGNIVGSGVTPIVFIASWDGIQWNQVGNGLPYSSFSLLKYNGFLYAGLTSGHTNPYKLVRLDGQNWIPLNSNVTNGGVYDLCEYQGAMYAAGNFIEIDSSCCYPGIAMYVDSLVGLPNEVPTLPEAISIFPNPATNMISLITNSYFDVEKLLIYDTTGRLVFEKSMNEASSIDISHLTPSLYFYEVQSIKGEIVYGKIIKQ